MELKKIESSLALITVITKDIEDDLANMEGRPLNGRVVAEQFGYQGAAISALANLVSGLFLELKDQQNNSGIIIPKLTP